MDGVKRSTGHTHTHTTAEQTAHTKNTEHRTSNGANGRSELVRLHTSRRSHLSLPSLKIRAINADWRRGERSVRRREAMKG